MASLAIAIVMVGIVTAAGRDPVRNVDEQVVTVAVSEAVPVPEAEAELDAVAELEDVAVSVAVTQSEPCSTKKTEQHNVPCRVRH